MEKVKQNKTLVQVDFPKQILPKVDTIRFKIKAKVVGLDTVLKRIYSITN